MEQIPETVEPRDLVGDELQDAGDAGDDQDRWFREYPEVCEFRRRMKEAEADGESNQEDCRVKPDSGQEAEA